MGKTESLKDTLLSVIELIKVTINLYPRRTLVIGLLLSSLMIYIMGLYLPLVILQIYDRIIPSAGGGTLTVLISIAVGLMFLEGILRFLRSYLISLGQSRYLHRLRCDVFESCMRAKMDSFQKRTLGSYMVAFNNFEKIKQNVGSQFILIAIDVPFISVYLFLLGFFSFPILLVCLCMMGSMFWRVLSTGTTLRDDLKEQERINCDKLDVLFYIFRDISQVKAPNSEETILNKYERHHYNYIDKQAEINNKFVDLSSIAQTVASFTTVFVVGVGAYLVIQDEITIGVMTACMILAGRIMEVTQRFATTWRQYERMIIIQDTIKDIHQIPLERQDVKLKLPNMDQGHEIHFHDVCYRGDMGYGLNNINFKIPFGTIVHLEGKDATAKEQILKLIAQEIYPSEGIISYGRISIDSYPVTTYRDQVCYLPKGGVLYHGTILQNLTNFREDEKTNQMAKLLVGQLNCQEQIIELPKAFDTMLTGTTVNEISKGLKQLICIIRALVNEPKIILFDEACSALDLATDSLLRSLFERIKGKMTMFIISHKPAIYTLADINLLVEDGKVLKKEE